MKITTYFLRQWNEISATQPNARFEVAVGNGMYKWIPNTSKLRTE